MKSKFLKQKFAMVFGFVLLCPSIAAAQDKSPTNESGSTGTSTEQGEKGAQIESLSNIFPLELNAIIDLEQAATAVRESDEEMLLGLAEKLGDTERGFPNPVQQKAIQAQIAFFKGSINACRLKRDGKALDAISKSIDASKLLPGSAKAELKGLINATRAAIASGRKLNPGPDLKVGEASPEAVAIYNAFLDEIVITEEYGTKEDVEALEAAVKQLKELHAKQRAHLLSLLKDASAAIVDRGAAEPTLALLASASRSISSGLKIVGPSTVKAGSKVQLTIISSGRISPIDKGTLVLSAQAVNAKLLGASAGKIEFSGKPLALQIEVGNLQSPKGKPITMGCSVSLFVNSRGTNQKSLAICQWSSKIVSIDPRK